MFVVSVSAIVATGFARLPTSIDLELLINRNSPSECND